MSLSVFLPDALYEGTKIYNLKEKKGFGKRYLRFRDVDKIKEDWEIIITSV